MISHVQDTVVHIVRLYLQLDEYVRNQMHQGFITFDMRFTNTDLLV